MIHGIERRKIFRNKKDREDFIKRLEVLCSSTGIGFSVDRGESIAKNGKCLKERPVLPTEEGHYLQLK
ncbi:MAG: hypothetical protein U9R17_02545 [Thermodesulfobacteriota bacterium]|nr:hypothetical protein [Thermodesulfobacteriota bacterium]